MLGHSAAHTARLRYDLRVPTYTVQRAMAFQTEPLAQTDGLTKSVEDSDFLRERLVL